ENKSKKPDIGKTIMMVFEPGVKYGKAKKDPNIAPQIFENLKKTYGRKPSPEEILYYIYAIFYSNAYREKYAEFLKIDFPRVPFTKDYELFRKNASFGKRLVELHLLKSNELDPTVAKYQGTSENDTIEKPVYKEKEQRIYINKEKYFEGVEPAVWNYYIGGYQVLQKYLKDRKGRRMDDPRHYVFIATSIKRTIDIQEEIDAIFSDIEKEPIEFSS
ncbi:MAG: hypothetical protein K8R79_00440, partial [Calditrichales bacterium]|nr:hypothetical protein [Calditrichales bacterium]